MSEIDMSVYDAMKPSINEYINLFDEFGIRLTNIKCHKIMLETRKNKAFEVLSKKIKGLEGEEQVEKWKIKLENVFNPPKKSQTEIDFTGYNVGDDVICYTSYKAERFVTYNTDEYCYNNMYVKCKIQKINKNSITLVKYNSKIDFGGARYALAKQTYGYIKFKWTTVGKQKVIVKNLSRITRKCDDLNRYQEYCEESSYFVDYAD